MLKLPLRAIFSTRAWIPYFTRLLVSHLAELNCSISNSCWNCLNWWKESGQILSVETLYTSVSGHATISVFKELVIPITNTLSPKIRYGVKATLISFTYRSNYFYLLYSFRWKLSGKIRLDLSKKPSHKQIYVFDTFQMLKTSLVLYLKDPIPNLNLSWIQYNQHKSDHYVVPAKHDAWILEVNLS